MRHCTTHIISKVERKLSGDGVVDRSGDQGDNQDFFSISTCRELFFPLLAGYAAFAGGCSENPWSLDSVPCLRS